MKALIVFLICAVPATGLLFYLDLGEQPEAELPAEDAGSEGPVLLSGDDLADAYGQSPFSGALRRLDGFELRVVEDGYFKLLLRIDRLGRLEGKPRLEGVEAAVFDKPKEGEPNLRLNLEAPFVSGDPRDLLYAPEDAPRIVTLDGGVKAFDAGGRLLAEVAKLALDVKAKTATADVPVTLRLPEHSAELRAEGIDADLQGRHARLKGPVLASVSGPAGSLTIRAKGGATVEEAAEGAEIRVAFEGDAEIEQEALRATCARIDAVLARAEGRIAFARARLSGGVRLALAPGTMPGLDSVDMPSVTVDGESSVSCEGPVRATWRGRLPDGLLGRRLSALALGERTVNVAADAARFTLGAAEDGRRVLAKARFERFSASDVDGAGSLSGHALTYDAAAAAVVLEGEVQATTPAASLRAGTLRVVRKAKDAFDVLIDGEKRVVYHGDAPTGALGAAGEVTLTATGPLRIAAAGDRVSFAGERDVVASTDSGARLRADALALELEKGSLLSFVATGGVVATDPARGAEIRGDRLVNGGGATAVEGSPASIETKDGRAIRAPRITYRDDRTFEAAGEIDVVATLAGGGSWRLRGGTMRGALGADGTVASVEAAGGIRALGPAGEEVTGESLSYDGAKGTATLLGDPARLRRGDEIAMAAPKGLTLRLADGRVAAGSSLGPATIDYRPATADGKSPASFDGWVAELHGPASFDGDRVVIPEGAKLRGSKDGHEMLLAEAKRVEILLDAADGTPRVKEIVGSRGVRVEGRGKLPAVVTADRLSFVAGSREVRVAGDAQVVAEGWPREARFRELLFALAKDGIDLKRASDVEVR
ncbi:MAG TPA: hypothetical protein VFY93_19860 [Planctomycetota bacterium]|nr:hypothetical protein [Planctomycetota bacterium]